MGLQSEVRRNDLLRREAEVQFLGYDPKADVPILTKVPGYAMIFLRGPEQPDDNNSYIRIPGLPQIVDTCLSVGRCKIWLNILVKDQNHKTTEKWFVLKNDDAKPGLTCNAEGKPPDVQIIQEKIIGDFGER
jgi:hypothetical protein